MSNPFKTKQLEDFTIRDCEDYLKSYPYGEHFVDVQKRLRGLKSGKIAPKCNPFATKQLSEFNINDCQSYLRDFPNGEHSVEVQRKLEELRNGIAKISTNLSKGKVKKNIPKISIEKKNAKDETSSTNTEVHNAVSSKVESESNNTIDTILSWIGLIVVVVIVGTIIIFVLDAILPEGAAKFINKYKYLIYPAGLALARWIDEKK